MHLRKVAAMSATVDGIVWDDVVAGLGLRTQNSKQTWICRYRAAGVQKQKTLGPGSLPRKVARLEAGRIILEARAGRDPLARAAAEKAALREAAQALAREEEARRTRSLAALVERYIAHAERELRSATARELKRSLQIHWQPLHDRLADELDRRAIVARLEAIQETSGAASARAARAYLSMACSWGVARGILERNPVAGLKPLTPARPRDRVLSAAELNRVWRAVDPTTEFGAIVRLLLLTGQRREEVAGMRWSELDLELARWRLPGARTKNHRPHEVPLSHQALTIITGRPQRPERELVFGNRAGPFSGWSVAKKLLDARLAVSGPALAAWRLHDLRRSAVTQMAEIGIAPHVVEAVVNHVSGHKAGVAGVYNHATSATEKKSALQRWADWLIQIVHGSDLESSRQNL